MSCIIRDLVELSGIADLFPDCPKAFTEISIDESVIIPDQKPDVEQILKVIADVIIINKRIVKTPIGKGVSGIISTGVKLVLEGILRQKIIYAADEPTQSVHVAEFEKPFSAFIILPKAQIPITPSLCDQVCVEAYIEDIYAKQIDKRTIFKNITIFLNATSTLFCQNNIDKFNEL